MFSVFLKPHTLHPQVPINPYTSCSWNCHIVIISIHITAFELPATTEPPTTEQPTGNNNSSVSTPSGGCGNVNPTETNMSTNGTDSMNISGARAEMFSQLEIGLLVAVIVLVVILICVLLCCCCMLICCSRRSSKEKESPVEVTEIKSSNHSAT